MAWQKKSLLKITDFLEGNGNLANINPHPIENEKKKGDRKEEKHPKAKPESGAIIVQVINLASPAKGGVCEKQNKSYGKKDDDPKDQKKD